MQTRNLGVAAFAATMTPKMRDVTDEDLETFDIFPYVESVPASDLDGHEVHDRLVEYVYRSQDDRFDHVLVKTKSKNVYLAVVVDLRGRTVYGHRLLNLNELYGLTERDD